jgi:hypothetical protein
MQPTATLDPHPGHATGPRTPEGKAISAMNGEIHGFCGERISNPLTIRVMPSLIFATLKLINKPSRLSASRR